MEQEKNPSHPQQPNSLPAGYQSKINFAVIVAIIVAVLVLVIGVGTGFLRFLKRESNNFSSSFNFSPKVKNEVFLARGEEIYHATFNVSEVLIFNYAKNQIIASKKIGPYPLASKVGHESDSVQYNPNTKEIFFLTEEFGPDLLDNFFCPGPGKDCHYTVRLYKIGLDQTQPTLLYEFTYQVPPDDHLPVGELEVKWVVNSFDNSILLVLYGPPEDNETIMNQIVLKRVLKKIDAETGKEVFTMEYSDAYPVEGCPPRDSRLFPDAKFTYQVIDHFSAPKGCEHAPIFVSLGLKKIDNTNGESTALPDIFEGENLSVKFIEFSPNNDYFAFLAQYFYRDLVDRNTTRVYTDPVEDRLYIYQIPTKKLIQVPKPYPDGSFTEVFLWSGDSKKLLYSFDKSWFYYDLETFQTVPVKLCGSRGYPSAWAAATNYLLYYEYSDSDDEYTKYKVDEVKICDIQNNKTITLPMQFPGPGFYLVGLKWY